MTTDTHDRPAPEFDRHMLEALVCPVTHTTLHYDAARQEPTRSPSVFNFYRPDHRPPGLMTPTAAKPR